jgi:hypothetical protein
MRWARFAVVISFFAWSNAPAQDFIRIVMNDGSGLKLPAQWFHDVEVVLGDARGGVLFGFSENRNTMFAYTRLNYNPGRHSPLFEALSQTMLLTVLKRRGLVHPSFNATEQVVDGVPIYRIEDPGGPFNDHLIYLDARSDQLGMGIFVLVGPAEEFSVQIPLMQAMMRSYALDITRIDPPLELHYLIGAVLALTANLAFVWYGFNRLSHYRHMGLADELSS